MLRHALETTHRRIGLFYSARTPGDFAYEDEWRRLADDGRIEFRQTITRDATSPSEWTGERGRIGRDALASLVHGPATLCFVCGRPRSSTTCRGCSTNWECRGSGFGWKNGALREVRTEK